MGFLLMTIVFGVAIFALFFLADLFLVNSARKHFQHQVVTVDARKQITKESRRIRETLERDTTLMHMANDHVHFN